MKTQFVTDEKGKKVAVLVPLKDYQKMIEEVDELNCIKAYDRIKEGKEEYLSAAEAFRNIEKKRRKH
jgi:PHD/YefM family antitoxin component YafN of YafNO toxin-antitoxin module